MKKRIQILAMVLLLALLSGCACKHEWTEADCLNPQVCTKCQETGTEALGHDWVKADCLTAETCSRCAATQGEPLGHSYGDWSFTETEMTHACTVCGAEETTELDRAVYLEYLLSGCWEFSALFRGDGSYYGSYSLSDPFDQLFFVEDRRVTGAVMTEPFDGNWEFQEYRPEENAELYAFRIPNTDGKVLPALLARQEDEDILYLYYNENDTGVLRRHDDAAEALSGTWGAEGLNGMCSLQLNPDRTVTGNLNGEFTGTWQLLDVMDHELLGKYCGLYIRFQRDGQEVILKGTAAPAFRFGDTPAEEFCPETITITYNNSKLEFTPMTQEEIDAKAKSLAEGPNMLIGTWASFSRSDISTSPATNITVMDYSATFHSDGTFTASMGKELTGTWQYEDSHSNGSGTSGSYSYYLYINETKSYHRAFVEYTSDHALQLCFSIGKGGTAESSVNNYFLKVSADEMTWIRDLLCGTWTSGDLEYQFTFSEDGTFTAFDGTDLKGRWVLLNARGDKESAVFAFDIYPKGKTESEWFRIYYHNGDQYETHADITYTPSGKNPSPSFRKYSQQLVDAAEEAPTYPIGEWRTTCVTHYGENREDERIETDAYTFTVRADGTITAQLVTGTVEGSWALKSISDSGYYYSFEYPGMPEYGPREFYVSTQENFMSYRVDDGDNGTFYQLERK